jgi:hypothetical protein
MMTRLRHCTAMPPRACFALLVLCSVTLVCVGGSVYYPPPHEILQIEALKDYVASHPSSNLPTKDRDCTTRCTTEITWDNPEWACSQSGDNQQNFMCLSGSIYSCFIAPPPFLKSPQTGWQYPGQCGMCLAAIVSTVCTTAVPTVCTTVVATAAIVVASND